MEELKKEILSYIKSKVTTDTDAKKFLSWSSVDISEYYEYDAEIFDHLSFLKQFVNEIASDGWIKTTRDAIRSFYFTAPRNYA